MNNVDSAFTGIYCLCLALAVTHPEPQKLYQAFGELMSLQIEQIDDADDDDALSRRLLAIDKELRALLGIRGGEAPGARDASEDS